jgi:multidrug resistance efflux pump
MEATRDTALKSVEKTDPKYESIENKFKEIFVQLELQKKAEIAKKKQLELQNAELKIAQADADWRAKKAQSEEAREMLNHFKITAPSDGTVLRANYHEGETLVINPLKHAIEFLPKKPIIVRAEVLQEWGRFIVDPQKNNGVGQEVEIEDDTFNGKTWQGKVESVSRWYAPTRTPVIEPFRYNDVRTMEIVIKVSGADDVRNGQRVRAMVKIK